MYLTREKTSVGRKREKVICLSFCNMVNTNRIFDLLLVMCVKLVNPTCAIVLHLLNCQFKYEI